jgi:UrcA family protein
MSTLHMVRKISPAILLAGLCLAASAFATNRLPSITVRATANKAVVGRSTIGAPIERVTLTRGVSYADLDLRTYAGAMELKRRVHEAAREACTKLDDLYPFEEREAPACISEAVAAASRQVDSAIARAQRVANAR